MRVFGLHWNAALLFMECMHLCRLMLWRRRCVLPTKSCNVLLLLILLLCLVNLIFVYAACVEPDSCRLYRQLLRANVVPYVQRIVELTGRRLCRFKVGLRLRKLRQWKLYRNFFLLRHERSQQPRGMSQSCRLCRHCELRCILAGGEDRSAASARPMAGASSHMKRDFSICATYCLKELGIVHLATTRLPAWIHGGESRLQYCMSKSNK